MWGRAQLLVLLTALSTYGDDVQPEENQLKVGRSIDIFTRYGYLSLSMKVVPRNDSDWIFREPTLDIFNQVEKFSNQLDRASRKQKRVFEGDFHMEFCDNVKQLVQAYFRDFHFEMFEKPWRAFSVSWSPDTIARNLGINTSFVQKEHYCYVLVRLSRFRESVRLTRTPNSLDVLDTVKKEMDNIKVGDVSSMMSFIRRFGSHYINSYVTGNSLYQVFVFNKTRYSQIKDKLKNQGISHISETELNQYFSPWHADHCGLIKVASGNKTVESWASSKLRHNYYIFTYPSLLKSKGDPRLLSRLNNLLKNEAVLEMELRTLATAFKDPLKKKWFEEVLDNFSKLWESNL